MAASPILKYDFLPTTFNTVLSVQDAFMLQKSSLSAKHYPLSSDADVRAQEFALAENGSNNDFTGRSGTQSIAPGTSSPVQSTLVNIQVLN